MTGDRHFAPKVVGPDFEERTDRGGAVNILRPPRRDFERLRGLRHSEQISRAICRMVDTGSRRPPSGVMGDTIVIRAVRRFKVRLDQTFPDRLT